MHRLHAYPVVLRGSQEKYPLRQLAGGLPYRPLRSEGETRSCPRGKPVPTLPHGARSCTSSWAIGVGNVKACQELQRASSPTRRFVHQRPVQPQSLAERTGSQPHTRSVIALDQEGYNLAKRRCHAYAGLGEDAPLGRGAVVIARDHSCRMTKTHPYRIALLKRASDERYYWFVDLAAAYQERDIVLMARSRLANKMIASVSASASNSMT